MRRLLFATVMVAALMCTTSLLADPADIEGYCQNVAIQCSNTCLSAWYGCRSMNQNPDTCQNQYDWCMDTCLGGDFWCGFRQV